MSAKSIKLNNSLQNKFEFLGLNVEEKEKNLKEGLVYIVLECYEILNNLSRLVNNF